MSTIRKWLDDSGFDWENGIIIIQETPEGASLGWSEPIAASYVPKEYPLLDFKFDSGFGSPECPRFIARDHKALYFPQQYDGSTRITKVYWRITPYLTWETNPTPYPGG